jgi:hypothetical protein
VFHLLVHFAGAVNSHIQHTCLQLRPNAELLHGVCHLHKVMQELKKTDTKFVQGTSNKKPSTESKTRTLGINRKSKCNQNKVSDYV